MQENRKQKDMFVKIPDNFTEQGLTLEQVYIKGRVERFNNVGLPYYESNKTLAKIMGKGETTVKRYIDELVKKGHLYRKTRTRKRLLSIKPFDYEVQNEPYKGYEYQNEPYEGFKMNHYKEERKEERKEEENPNLKNRSTDFNNLTPEEKEKTLKEALENMNYRHDEDFY